MRLEEFTPDPQSSTDWHRGACRGRQDPSREEIRLLPISSPSEGGGSISTGSQGGQTVVRKRQLSGFVIYHK